MRIHCESLLYCYDPTEELAAVLLKPGDPASTYRLGIAPPGPQGTSANEGTLSPTAEPAAEQRLEPSGVETPIEWEAYGRGRTSHDRPCSLCWRS